ncbi:hypothetical protein [Microbulbifer celer]|uniref:Uncharacterized protein n=1 Tax=Microbulbifer celer TaxID=435905 RepID=A0ABW3UE97_9GAMM|nr:hypothetical protein [Microbulbifer celer]UFN55870.1 hypothetical protein LPW13_09780 [Microbulbifer celer]
MKKSSIAVSVAIIGMLTTVAVQLLFQAGSESFALGLSSDYWGGFFGSGGIGLMLVLLFALFRKPKNG